MEAAQLSLPHLVRPPKIELPRPALLVLVHGEGGDEHALFEWAHLFDDRFMVVSPRAPHSVMSRSYAWLQLTDYPTRKNLNNPRTEQSCSVLINFIKEAARAYGADPNLVFLLGVGQGGVMCLSAMVAAPELLAGVVIANGQVPAEIHSILMPNERFRDFPVLVMHGLNDAVYPIEYGREAEQILSALLTDLTYREYEYGSTPGPEALNEARFWLAQRLNQRGVSFVPRQALKPPPYKLQLTRVKIGVRSLDRSIAFYSRFLGLHLIERIGSAYAFLGFKNANHHEIALENVGSNAPTLPRNSLGLHHTGFEAPDRAAFALAYKTLTSAGIKVTTVDHMIRWSIYFADPDRNGIEIYWDTREQPGKAALWQGRDLPLEPEKILAALEELPARKGI